MIVAFHLDFGQACSAAGHKPTKPNLSAKKNLNEDLVETYA